MEQERLDMKHCPRCGHKTMFNSDVLNPVSKVDGKTRICPNCGKEENWIAAGLAEPGDLDKAFRTRLGKEAG